MNYPRFVLWAVSLLLASAGLVPHAAGASELLVAGTTFARVFERSTEGEFSGLGVELVRAMARMQGDTVRFELYPWVRAQQMVAEGQADVLVGPYKTAQREAQFHFMDLPFYQDNLLFYARAGQGQAWDGHYASLKGRRIVTVLGWAYGAPFDAGRAGLDITPVPSVDKGLTLLLNSRADLLAANERNAASSLAILGPHGEFTPLAPMIGREVGYFAFPRDAQHEALRLAFNTSFKKLVDSGEYTTMARRLGVTIPTSAAPPVRDTIHATARHRTASHPMTEPSKP